MTSRPPIRRLALALTLALTLSAFVVALLGPAQTLAQTRKAACPTSATHGNKKHAARCTQPSHKGRAQTHHPSKHRVKPNTKTTGETSPPASAPAAPALCEDGNTPVRAADGSFSCADGSEPECEGGASPTASHSGHHLLCPVSAEAESSSNEAECKQEGSGCATGAGEEVCETSGSGDSSEFACED
ncbi:MAG TPA: hypothetical protein VGX72_00150 [Solirubrobacteraceae bacterium]|nr:hypothetical protein [Solirubrobacteraceae bacterium]